MILDRFGPSLICIPLRFLGLTVFPSAKFNLLNFSRPFLSILSGLFSSHYLSDRCTVNQSIKITVTSEASDRCYVACDHTQVMCDVILTWLTGACVTSQSAPVKHFNVCDWQMASVTVWRHKRCQSEQIKMSFNSFVDLRVSDFFNFYWFYTDLSRNRTWQIKTGVCCVHLHTKFAYHNWITCTQEWKRWEKV